MWVEDNQRLHFSFQDEDEFTRIVRQAQTKCSLQEATTQLMALLNGHVRLFNTV